MTETTEIPLILRYLRLLLFGISGVLIVGFVLIVTDQH